MKEITLNNIIKEEFNMKKHIKNLSIVAITILIFATSNVYARGSNNKLPEKIIRNGVEYKIDQNSRRTNSAELDSGISLMSTKGYKVLGSEVALYIDYSHGQGGDQFAAGWVQTNAPKFTARAEVWKSGKLETTGSNNKNQGDIARSTSALSVYIDESRYARIFYNWGWDLAGTLGPRE